MTNMLSPLRIASFFFAVISTSSSSAFFIAPAAQTQNHVSTNKLIASTSISSLSMAPRFDKSTGKWFTDKPDEMDGSSYGPIGSLYRAGPKPFLQRIFNAETYDQAVLKYMAQDGCDRREAQGNMDAFLENPQDWAYQKVQEKNGAYKKDYANANMAPKQVALSSIWAVVVVYFFGSLAYNGVQGGMLSSSFSRTMELLGVNN